MGTIPTRDDLLKLISIEEKVMQVKLKRIQDSPQAYAEFNVQRQRVLDLVAVLETDQDFTE